MVSIQRPTDAQVKEFLEKQAELPFSYHQVGLTQEQKKVEGYNNDHNQILLGKGEAVYHAACHALRNWQMFPSDWTWIEPPAAPIKKGQNLAMVARLFGLHWVNGCRIVYTLNGTGPDRRFGFAYGTLPSHVETGEERFSIEWRTDDTVWYDLKAFSHPRLWLLWLAYPIARAMQRRFVRESLQRMKHLVQTATKQ